MRQRPVTTGRPAGRNYFKGDDWMTFQRIRGCCPMGCGETLFVGSEGHVTCNHAECPNPSKVDEILDTKETEHVVILHDQHFNVLHPLRERPEELLNCALARWIADHDGPPQQPGRYRVTPRAVDGYSESYRGDSGRWDWERIGDR